MKTITLVVGATYAAMSVILGALGSHMFKKILSPERLTSFETGVRYQMYSALILLLIGFFFKFEASSQRWVSLLMMIGAFLFSVSIYVLSFQSYWGVNLRFLGPVTPVGGMMMILSLLLLIYVFASKTYE